MATITTSDWDNTGVSKQGSWQALTVSKQKVKVFNVAFGACENYTTGGITLDLSDGGRIQTATFVITGQLSDPSLIPAYTASACDVASTGKIQFFHEAAGACATELAELACASCATNSVSLKVFVIGK